MKAFNVRVYTFNDCADRGCTCGLWSAWQLTSEFIVAALDHCVAAVRKHSLFCQELCDHEAMIDAMRRHSIAVTDDSSQMEHHFLAHMLHEFMSHAEEQHDGEFEVAIDALTKFIAVTRDADCSACAVAQHMKAVLA